MYWPAKGRLLVNPTRPVVIEDLFMWLDVPSRNQTDATGNAASVESSVCGAILATLSDQADWFVEVPANLALHVEVQAA